MHDAEILFRERAAELYEAARDLVNTLDWEGMTDDCDYEAMVRIERAVRAMALSFTPARKETR